MADLSVRRLDDDVVATLRIKAAEAGISLEEHIRRILRQAANPELDEKVGTRIEEIFADTWDGQRLEIPDDGQKVRPPPFSDEFK